MAERAGLRARGAGRFWGSKTPSHTCRSPCAAPPHCSLAQVGYVQTVTQIGIYSKWSVNNPSFDPEFRGNSG
jgi:hypothetical protein